PAIEELPPGNVGMDAPVQRLDILRQGSRLLPRAVLDGRERHADQPYAAYESMGAVVDPARRLINGATARRQPRGPLRSGCASFRRGGALVSWQHSDAAKLRCRFLIP